MVIKTFPRVSKKKKKKNKLITEMTMDLPDICLIEGILSDGNYWLT